MRIGPSFSIERSLLAFKLEKLACRINTNRNQKNDKWLSKNYLQGEITNFMPYRIGWRFYSNEFEIYFTPGNKQLHFWLVITIFQMGGS